MGWRSPVGDVTAGRHLNSLTSIDGLGYLFGIANHEVQVERKRTYNPVSTMTGSVAPIPTVGAGEFLVDIAPRRLH